MRNSLVVLLINVLFADFFVEPFCFGCGIAFTLYMNNGYYLGRPCDVICRRGGCVYSIKESTPF